MSVSVSVALDTGVRWRKRPTAFRRYRWRRSGILPSATRPGPAAVRVIFILDNYVLSEVMRQDAYPAAASWLRAALPRRCYRVSTQSEILGHKRLRAQRARRRRLDRHSSGVCARRSPTLVPPAETQFTSKVSRCCDAEFAAVSKQRPSDFAQLFAGHESLTICF